MFALLQIVSVLIVAVATTLAVAHALELPSKLRSDREHYDATQASHWSVFTIAGLLSEGAGLGCTLLVLLATPARSASLVWTAASFLSLAAMHGVYWAITHPASQFWLVRHPVSSIAPVGFFATHPLPRPPMAVGHWTRSRSRMEHSHVLRAVLGGISLIAIITGLAVD